MTRILSRGTSNRRLKPGTVAVVGLLFSATIALAGDVDVTACNQTVPSGATGVLVSDLDCSLSYGTYAVVLSNSAKLRLNGFTIRSDADGIDCLGSCRITGPGEVARTLPSCDMQSFIDTYGVFAAGTVTLDQVTFTSWGYATYCGSRLRAKNVVVTGQCLGLVGNYARVSVRDSTITDNLGLGVGGSGSVTVVGSTVTGNFVDVSAARRPRVNASTCQSSVGGASPPPDTWDVCSNP